MIDSRNFYNFLKNAFDDVRREVEASGAPEVEIFIFSHPPSPYSDDATRDFKIMLDGYGVSGLKVEGRDLEECVEEYIRRAGFKRRQEAKQLAAPTPDPKQPENSALDGEFEEIPGPGAPSQQANPQDDEIVF